MREPQFPTPSAPNPTSSIFVHTKIARFRAEDCSNRAIFYAFHSKSDMSGEIRTPFQVSPNPMSAGELARHAPRMPRMATWPPSIYTTALKGPSSSRQSFSTG